MKKLSDLRRNAWAEEPEVNPLEFVANLADAMLILSVGIMLALVINWNVDISTEVDKKDSSINTKNALSFEEKDVSQVDKNAEAVSGGDLHELGTVYFDKETGKYYIIEKGGE